MTADRKPIPKSMYDADYFLRGAETGKSLYTDYRWLPELTIPMAEAMVKYLGIDRDDRVLDYGCARGYLVKALRGMGYDAWGYDPSVWAIENCDPEVRGYLSHMSVSPADWIIAKDVLEHVDTPAYVIPVMMEMARVGIFVVVPLAPANGCDYVVPEYEKDVTHLHRYMLGTWAAWFMRAGWSVTACYRVPGIKDNYYKPGWEEANGFITARRIKC